MNFEKYKGEYVMHCKTEREAEEFCAVMHAAGLTRHDGSSYEEYTGWVPYRPDIYYAFNVGRLFYLSDYGLIRGYTVLEWSDFRTTAAPITHLTLKVPEIERGEEDVWSMTRQIANTFVASLDDNILEGIKQICEEKHPGVTDVIVFDKSAIVKMLRLYYDYQNNGCWKPLPGEVCYTIDPAAPGGVQMIYWGGSYVQEILYRRGLIWKEEQGAKDKAGQEGWIK